LLSSRLSLSRAVYRCGISVPSGEEALVVMAARAGMKAAGRYTVAPAIRSPNRTHVLPSHFMNCIDVIGR
jgi:hypothetical protein